MSRYYLDQKKIARVAALRKKGVSFREIMRIMEISSMSTIHRWALYASGKVKQGKPGRPRKKA